MNNRRRTIGCLKLIVALGIAAASTSCVHRPPGAADAVPPDLGKDSHLQRFEFNRPQMGVPFRIVLHAATELEAAAAAKAAFARIAELNDILSDYDSDSELSRLSRTSGMGFEVSLGPDLWTVLSRAQRLAKKSDGAFDVTVGPVVNLWRKARRDVALPRPDLLGAARARVGWRKLELDRDGRTARLAVENMRLDLGGIAKGYAVDEALKVLGTNGIRSALVSGGGDMAVSDPPPGRAGWEIKLVSLDVTNAPPARTVLLRRAALATSGDVFQHVEIDGVRYSHIVDPRSGIGLTDHSLVTVIARDCTTADSLATAVSVLGPEKGTRLAQSEGAVVQIMRAREGRAEVWLSPGFERYFGTARE